MVKVSNADRVVFPDAGHTKGQVVAYYERVAERMLPHVAGRPLTIKRYPKGIGAPGFFQKNVPPHYPASMARLEVQRKDGVTIHPIISEPDHIPYVANQGAIELHVPCGRGADLFHPDRFVIDLDPPEGAVDLVRKAAHIVKDELEALGVATVPVATGSKGYHIVAALDAAEGFDAIGGALQELGALLASKHPDEMTTAFRIANRGGRVFLDWLRNQPQATVVAPYSLRARKNAGIATPLAWAELDTTAPDRFTLATADALFDRDDSLLALAKKPSNGAAFVRAVGDAFRESGLELEKFDRFRS